MPAFFFAPASLKTLGEACRKAGWEIHAYCLSNLLSFGDGGSASDAGDGNEMADGHLHAEI